MEKSEPSGFAEFWDIWRPHKRHTDGRGLARACFQKHLLDGVDPRDIIDGARWFIRNLKDPAYIPLSATWLNRCDYEDGCILERDYQIQMQARGNAQNVTPIRPAGQTAFLQRWKAGTV